MFVGKGQLQNPSADFTGHRGTSPCSGAQGLVGAPTAATFPHRSIRSQRHSRTLDTQTHC